MAEQVHDVAELTRSAMSAALENEPVKAGSRGMRAA
jgi:hypothetical protein